MLMTTNPSRFFVKFKSLVIMFAAAAISFIHAADAAERMAIGELITNTS